MVDILKKTLAENLEKLRKERGETHIEMSKKLGISRATLYNYLTMRWAVSTEVLYMIWERYGVSPNEMMKITKD